MQDEILSYHIYANLDVFMLREESILKELAQLDFRSSMLRKLVDRRHDFIYFPDWIENDSSFLALKFRLLDRFDPF